MDIKGKKNPTARIFFTFWGAGINVRGIEISNDVVGDKLATANER